MLRNVERLGVSAPVLRRAAESGRAVRLARGVYAAGVPEDPVAAHLQRAIALQLRRPYCLASHQTAALAWGLALPDVAGAAAGPVEFTAVPSDRRRSLNRPDFTLALRPLPADHRALQPPGLALTTPARTAVDVAARMGLPEALMVLDSAARMLLIESVGTSRLRQAYEAPRSLRSATLPLVQAAAIASTRLTAKRLARYLELVDPRRESALESYSYGRILEAGLPLPLVQQRISTPLGDFYPDFFWPDARLIGEADGKSKYRAVEDLQWQVDRQAALEDLGHRFVRWSYTQMFNTPWIPLTKLDRYLS